MTQPEQEAREMLADKIGATMLAEWDEHDITRLIVAAMLAFAARSTAGIDRATLAQIIDPKAWETRARHLDDTDWEKNHPSMRIAVSMRQAGAVIADEVVARSLAKADAILALLPAPAKTGERGAVIEECAIAARNAMVDMEWPPQDGDREIDEVLAAIRALSQPLPDDGGPK